MNSGLASPELHHIKNQNLTLYFLNYVLNRQNASFLIQYKIILLKIQSSSSRNCRKTTHKKIWFSIREHYRELNPTGTWAGSIMLEQSGYSESNSIRDSRVPNWIPTYHRDKQQHDSNSDLIVIASPPMEPKSYRFISRIRTPVIR